MRAQRLYVQYNNELCVQVFLLPTPMRSNYAGAGCTRCTVYVYDRMRRVDYTGFYILGIYRRVGTVEKFRGIVVVRGGGAGRHFKSRAYEKVGRHTEDPGRFQDRRRM